MFKLVIQIVFMTIFMIAMIKEMKKVSIYLENKNYDIYKDKNMKILEKIILSKDKEIFLVQVYGKKYFIGASNNNISILKELDFEYEENKK